MFQTTVAVLVNLITLNCLEAIADYCLLEKNGPRLAYFNTMGEIDVIPRKDGGKFSGAQEGTGKSKHVQERAENQRYLLALLRLPPHHLHR